jgi:putative acetyltransferase
MGRAAPVGLEYRRAEPHDAEALAQFMADPAVFAGLLQLPYPGVEAWRKRLESRAHEQDQLHLLALAEGVVVGSAGLHSLAWTPRRRHVAGLGISVAAAWQGKGVGDELMRRLLEWADNWAGYLRIELSVYVDNARAIALYRKHGFVEEGTSRAHALRDGVYVDSLLMARLHPRPPQLPQLPPG